MIKFLNTLKNKICNINHIKYKYKYFSKSNYINTNSFYFNNIVKSNFSVNNSESEYTQIYFKNINDQLEKINKSNYNEDQVKTFLNFICDIAKNKQIKVEIFEKVIPIIDNILNNLNESNMNQILPKLIQTLYQLKIGDPKLWDRIEDLYFKNIENIDLSNHLNILNFVIDIFKMHFREDIQRADRFKLGFLDFMFAFETQDYLDLSLKQIILFLAIFSDSFTKNHNELLYQIQQILVHSHLQKLLSKENDVNLFALTIFKLMINPEISIDFLMEKLLNEIYKNISWLDFKSQLFIITSYRLFLEKNKYTPNSHFYKKIQKIAKLIDEDFSVSNLDKLHISEIVEVLITFSHFEVGSSDFYLEIDKIIGNKINEIEQRLYLNILDAFVKTKNYREKFITLMQNKVYENKEKIKISDLCKIMRIFASLKLSNETIFEKMQNFILSNKHNLEDYDISDFIFGYSNLKTKNNFVLSDMEEFVDHNSVKWAANKKFDIIIDILNSYLIAEKGEKYFLENMKNLILNSYNKIRFEEIDDYSVFKMFHIFYKMKLNYEDIKLFDNLLRNKLKFYTVDEYVGLFKFLSELEYKNESTLSILKELVRIGDNYKEKAEYFEKMNLL